MMTSKVRKHKLKCLEDIRDEEARVVEAINKLRHLKSMLKVEELTLIAKQRERAISLSLASNDASLAARIGRQTAGDSGAPRLSSLSSAAPDTFESQAAVTEGSAGLSKLVPSAVGAGDGRVCPNIMGRCGEVAVENTSGPVSALTTDVAGDVAGVESSESNSDVNTFSTEDILHKLNLDPINRDMDFQEEIESEDEEMDAAENDANFMLGL